MKSIILSGGCFWGVEAYFNQLDGVTETEVGYIGGQGNTTYEDVCNGSGHAECVFIRYDQEVISLKKILDHFFNIINPTSLNKQGPDIGVQYRTGIYNYGAEDKVFINNYLSVRQKEYNKPLAIEVVDYSEYIKAETNHQEYLKKNKNGYCHIRLDSYQDVS
ncbi:MAG: peptide-methionine (S)-S-oxide reductase MsrA [Candidatus Izemoplasma sp.]